MLRASPTLPDDVAAGPARARPWAYFVISKDPGGGFSVWRRTAADGWIVAALEPGEVSTASVPRASLGDALWVAPVVAMGASLRAGSVDGPAASTDSSIERLEAALRAYENFLPEQLRTALVGISPPYLAGDPPFVTITAVADAAGRAVAGTPLGSQLGGAGIDTAALGATLDLPAQLPVLDPWGRRSCRWMVSGRRRASPSTGTR